MSFYETLDVILIYAPVTGNAIGPFGNVVRHTVIAYYVIIVWFTHMHAAWRLYTDGRYIFAGETYDVLVWR